MIVDTPASIDILQGEREAAAIADALDQAPICRISAVGYVEAGVVIDDT